MNNRIRKNFISVICGCIVMFSSVLVASASTSQSLEQLTMLEYKQSVFGDNMTAPTSKGHAGNETINTASGNLQLSSTDLYLKGKGGLDLEIKRNYDSLISTEFKDEIYGVGAAELSQRKTSEKLIYKYYINDTSNYVYIYYDNEEQLLKKENANGEIYTSQTYSNYVTSYKTSDGTYQDYYQSLMGENFEDIKQKGFIKHYELPSGNAVKLKRDKSLKCDKVTYTSVNAFEAIACKITPNYITLAEDWYFSLDKIVKLSTTSEDVGSYTYYTESGNLLTRDGEMLSYEAEYRYNSKKEIYEPSGGNVISNEGDSKMYSISIDYARNTMLDNDEAEMGFRYTTKVTDYQGKKLYFNNQGDLVAEEDRFGNRIIYNKSQREIIDTYGRVINLPKGTQKSIRVNGKEVVKYSVETENNNDLDPYKVLEADNKKHLKVNYNVGKDEWIIYTTQNHRNLYRLQKNNDMTTPSAYNTDINDSESYPTLEEITLPTGAKIKYEYEKVNSFFHNKGFSHEKYKIKSRQDIETDGTVSNKYTYTYDNPTEGLLKSKDGRRAHTTTAVRASDGYTVIDNYDNLGRLESKETRAGDDYTISNFKYEPNREGGYNVTQESVKKYNKNDSSDYIENTTDYEYNDVQQVTKKATGDYTEKYSYNSLAYYLPSQTEVYRGDGLYTRNSYTNDGKSITKVVTSDVKSNRVTQVKSVEYKYNECGDLIYESDTNKHYAYNYSDMSFDEGVDTAYNQGNSLVVTETLKAHGIVDEDGNTVSGDINTSSIYDMFGNIVSIEDAKGNITQYEYDNQQRLIKTTYPDGSFNQNEYFDSLNEIVTTDANGNKTKLCYDSLGRYSAGYLFNPESNAWILAEKYTYDANGNVKTLLSNRNEDGNQAVRVEYSYYPDGRKKSEAVKNADNNVILSEYTVGRNYYYTDTAASVGTPARGITYSTVQYKNSGGDYVNVTTNYDLFGNKVKETIDGRAGGTTYDAATTQYTYDYAGNLLTQKEPNLVASNSAEYSVQNVYDALGNVVKTTNINKKSATNEYNTTTGLLIKSTDFNGNTTSYAYNCFNQAYLETLPTGGKKYTYCDVNGNVAKVSTLRESNIYDSVRYIYDSRNRNIAVIGNDGEKDVVTQYEYDKAGNRTKLIQGLEEISDLKNLAGKDYSINEYTYNYLNQCISATDAMGQTQTYEYDLFGNVLQSVDRNGDTISYTYTPLGYLTSVSSSKDNTSVSYTYDNFGNRTSMSDDTGATSYEYNIFNQLVNETKGSLVKDYTYDLNGNQLSFKMTDNGKVTLNESYAYDKTNQVSSITAADVTANFTYDNNGNMLTYKRNSITTAYTYNEGNMPVSVRTYKGSNYENDTIAYYLNGNKKTTKDINNNTTTYEYDGMGRLSSEQETNGYSAVYSYDNYGNRIGKTVNDGDNSHNICYTYDKNNHLITETKDVQGGQEINRYFYDANGNQTYRNEEKITLSTQKDYSVKLNSGGHGTSYEYDGLNRLVRADDGTNISTYTYDGNNLRQSKTVNGVTTRHIYNGMNVVQEKEANSLKATYHRVGNQIIYSEVQGSKNFYIYNAQGNVSKLLNAAGETVADYTFDAFGVQKSVSGDVYNPFRHNGEYYDEELGYTYLRNRYYDNNIGRFITEDPVKDGLNWYSYCSGNPVMFRDSMGLWLDGDESLSQGAQTYTTYYGNKWWEAHTTYVMAMANHDEESARMAKAEMEAWHQKAEDIRRLDANGQVEGKTLPVPIYTQKDTFPHDDTNNLCWACCHAMLTSFYLNDNIDRTLNVASYTNSFIIPLQGTPLTYNNACFWISTDKLYFGVNKSQTQYYTILSEDEILFNIESNNPFGVLYSNFDFDGERLGGHWVLGIGYASAEGHESLVVSNDPWNDERKHRIQTYTEFQRYGNAIWDETAINDY